MKNKLTDLNNHLFEQLERLNDEELSDQELEREIKRSKALSDIAGKIKQTRPGRLGWKQVHRINWEKVHGPVPDDCAIIFIDQNRLNTNVENLMLVTRAELARINVLKLNGNPDRNRAIITLGKINTQIANKEVQS